MQILWVSQFDESSAVSTIYLDKTDRTRKGVIKAQEQFSITDQSTTVGNLLDCTEWKILLDSGAAKSFMSKNTILEINLCMDYQSSIQNKSYARRK